MNKCTSLEVIRYSSKVYTSAKTCMSACVGSDNGFACIVTVLTTMSCMHAASIDIIYTAGPLTNIIRKDPNILAIF